MPLYCLSLFLVFVVLVCLVYLPSTGQQTSRLDAGLASHQHTERDEDDDVPLRLILLHLVVSFSGLLYAATPRSSCPYED